MLLPHLGTIQLNFLGTVPPSPSAPATSSAPTEQIITPATNPSEPLPNMNNNAAKMQYVQNQMATFRNIQSRAAESGNLDMSSPGMQQIKSLLSLQQQQKSGQVAMNPGAALQAQGSGSGGGTDQLLMAAMRQQMLQQGQGQGQVNNGQQQQQAQQRTQAQPQPQAQPQQQNQRPAQTQNQVWSGNLIWTINSSSRCKSPFA
jgi:hypothetical protein